MTQVTQTRIVRVSGGAASEGNDWVAREEPLEIRVRGRSVAVTMRTPGQDEELACGFLWTEGLLTRREDVVEIAPCPAGEGPRFGNILNVFLRPSARFDFERLTRHTFASSSCGLCGKASIEAVHQYFPPLENDFRIADGVLPRLPGLLQREQAAFAQTGGLHAAGLFDAEGRLLTAREDIGRHNAVDKVIGWAFLGGQLPLDRHILLVSGRASFEIVQKALAARIPVIAAVSAPSSLAVEFAAENRQTLAGFVRGESFNVYSCPERLARLNS